MLDRPDTFQETSCSAIFTYAIAKGVNHGWLNSTTYGPVAEAGWNGLTTRVDSSGRLSGVCIGTGTGQDYVFYYARPSTDDVHGYGPMLLAGSEIIRMLQNKNFTIMATTRPLGSVTFIPRGNRPQ
jgi:rhamnogalacturonyl hydrolase YesR